MRDQLRILLVDDSEVARDVIYEVLASIPFIGSIDTACDIATGLAALKLHDYDCLLLDFWLPDGDSFAFLEQARSAGRFDAAVIILTAQDDEDTAVEAVRHGVEDFLDKKGLEARGLFRAIRYAVERHRIKQDLDRARQSLETLTTLDPLTQLLNRRGLDQMLHKLMHQMNRIGSNLVVVLVDLDDFKSINDTLGHAVGDVVLREVAARIQRSLRSGDYVSRIGGDEFMLVLPETRLIEGVEAAEKVRLAISRSPVYVSPDQNVYMTASLGAVPFADIVPSIDALIAECRGSLHRSKHDGKNRVTTTDAQELGSSPDSLARVLGALRVETAYEALAQPIVDVSTLAVHGYEMLARLRVPGFSEPRDFFTVARQANMIPAVDSRCLGACIGASRSLNSGVECHINVFPSTLLGMPVESIVSLLAGGAGGVRYCVEISEQQIIGDPSYLVESVRALRSAGVAVAVDDMGFGRSCLESLILLEPETVKIDRKFVTDAHSSPGRIRSLRRLLDVLNTLHVKVIAEGVESEDDLRLLRDLGVPYAQGFHLGRPQVLETRAND